MKKRIFSILLSLCMALLIFPVTAYAEDLKPITEINVDVDNPIIGEHPEYSWSTTSTPTSVIDVDLEWFQISKDDYTGTSDDVWKNMFNTGYTCKEGYYYRVVCPINIYSRYKETHTIPNDVKATINGKECDIQIADDGKSCFLSYMFEAKERQSVTNITATIDEPVLGEKPDYNPQFTVDPKGSVKLEKCRWHKISQDNYTGKHTDRWDEVDKDDVFEAGYYYAAEQFFVPSESYYILDEDITVSLNGKSHYDAYGTVYHGNYAYLCGVFDPVKPEYTLKVPFMTTVKQGGNVAPGKTDFKLELVNFEGQKISNDNVKVNAVVSTNGKGSYKGNMTITGTLDEIMRLFDGMLFVKQVDEGKENWTYDDTVWGLVSLVELSGDDDLENVFDVHILPTICEKTENGMFYQIEDGAYEVDSMSFTNTYTKSVSVTTKPTDPTKDNSNTGTKKNVETGDSSNLALWFALLAVSTVGVIGTTVYNKRRRNTQSK